MKPWYETWFDSPYYHLLYQHRDETEAAAFLDRLIDRLGMQPGARVLDVACGKGRHSIHLYKRGFDVCGFDLSKASIQHDLQFENERLHFFVHDMREVFRVNYFDYVLNLFSSFGYFDSERENFNAFRANATACRPGGTVVVDFFNIRKACAAGNSTVEQTIDGITFVSRKQFTEHHVQKEVRFFAAGEDRCFTEQVRLFSREDFHRFTRQAGLTVLYEFGDYNLNPFDENSSDRYILVARKPS
jgi:SAM-dependent methyltransferase